MESEKETRDLAIEALVALLKEPDTGIRYQAATAILAQVPVAPSPTERAEASSHE